MSNLSRRNVVASAVALPVLAVPASAKVGFSETRLPWLPVFSPDHPDAELLRLGAQLDAIGQRRDALEVRVHRNMEEHDAACARAGIPEVPHWQDVKDTMSESEFYDRLDTTQTARNAIPYGKDWGALCKEHDAAVEEVGDLAQEILDLTPTTLDGLRVQAKALNWGMPEWPRLGSEEYGESLILSVFALVGVEPGGSDPYAKNREDENHVEG